MAAKSVLTCVGFSKEYLNSLIVTCYKWRLKKYLSYRLLISLLSADRSILYTRKITDKVMNKNWRGGRVLFSLSASKQNGASAICGCFPRRLGIEIERRHRVLDALFSMILSRPSRRNKLSSPIKVQNGGFSFVWVKVFYTVFDPLWFGIW